MRSRAVEGAETLDEIKLRATALTPEDRIAVKDALLALTDGRSFLFGTEPLPDGATKRAGRSGPASGRTSTP